MTDTDLPNLKSRLLEDGFVIIPGAVDATGMAAMSTAAKALLQRASAEHFEKNRTTGSMLSIADSPDFAKVIAWPKTLEILRGLGFGRVAFSAGYVISKPPGGPRLFWHQDWLWWTHPVSADPTPHQLFAMYYLVDTDRSNGCLRVIPGSHRRHLPAHDQLTRAHSPEVLAGANADHPVFGDLDGEIDVPVKAGDLLLGDARLLHAAHNNGSQAERTLLTLWYHPAYDALPPELQGYLTEKNGGALDAWPSAARNQIDCLLPFSDGQNATWPICRDPHVPFAPGS